jgi:HEAT repeat protein
MFRRAPLWPAWLVAVVVVLAAVTWSYRVDYCLRCGEARYGTYVLAIPIRRTVQTTGMSELVDALLAGEPCDHDWFDYSRRSRLLDVVSPGAFGHHDRFLEGIVDGPPSEIEYLSHLDPELALAAARSLLSPDTGREGRALLLRVLYEVSADPPFAQSSPDGQLGGASYLPAYAWQWPPSLDPDGLRRARELLELPALDPLRLAEDMPEETRRFWQWTPLHFAAYFGDADSARGLLNAGGQPDPADRVGFTPLYYAAARGDLRMTRLLLEYGADADGPPQSEERPLHQLSATGEPAGVAEALLQAGADADARARYGRTPLHKAVFLGHVPLLEVLLDHGADANAQDSDGNTPLHWAAGRGDCAAISCLLARGADPSIRNAEGMTPGDRARSDDHEAAARLLEVREHQPLLPGGWLPREEQFRRRCARDLAQGLGRLERRISADGLPFELYNAQERDILDALPLPKGSVGLDMALSRGMGPEEAARAAGYAGVAEAVEALMAAADRDRPDVFAYRMLGELGAPAAVPLLLRRAREDEDKKMPADIGTWDVHERDPGAALTFMQGAWMYEYALVPIAPSAVQALGLIADSSAVPGLLGLLRDPEFRFRAVAAAALGRTGDPDALPGLLDVMSGLEKQGGEEDDAHLHEWCRRAIVEIATRQRPTPQLIQQLSSEDRALVYYAIRALADRGAVEAVPALAELSDDDRAVQRSPWFPIVVETVGRGARDARAALARTDGAAEAEAGP